VDHVILELAVLVQVVEWNSVALNTDLFDKISQITVGTLSKISEKTMLELAVLLLLGIGSNFLLNLVAEVMLIAKHVTDAALINGHTLFVGVVHSHTLMSISVLHRVVFCLRDFSELFELTLVNNGVHYLFDDLTASRNIGMSVLNQMN